MEEKEKGESGWQRNRKTSILPQKHLPLRTKDSSESKKQQEIPGWCRNIHILIELERND
jgi:hypothetical protein